MKGRSSGRAAPHAGRVQLDSWNVPEGLGGEDASRPPLLATRKKAILNYGHNWVILGLIFPVPCCPDPLHTPTSKALSGVVVYNGTLSVSGKQT